MNNYFGFSDEESEEVDKLLNTASKRAQFPLTIEYLLNAWKSFVIQVENGYTESYYEYINDLATRDILEDLIRISRGSIRGKLLNFLEPLDLRFYQATVESDVLKAPEDRNNYAWWYRIPKILTGELRSDLGL
jgi:hypothetical protein